MSLRLALGLACVFGLAVPAASTGAPSSGQKTVRIGFVLPALSNAAILDIKVGAEARAKKLGGIRILTVASYKGEAQAQAIENFIAAKVDVIAYDSIDAAAVGPAIVKANKAKIPVIAIVSKANTGKHATFIAADWRYNGNLIGTWMNQALGGKGKVALLEGNPADSADQGLKNGFIAGIQANGSSIKLVADQPTNWDRAQALSVATNVLTANPDLQGLYGMNDDVALGALEALKAAHRQVQLAGHNGTCEMLQHILQGDVNFTVLLFNGPLGAQAVDTALGVLKGKKFAAYIRAPSVGLTTATAKAVLAGKTGGLPANLVSDVRRRLQLAQGGCK
jgi:ABC-type sugar transport system substrate-binding protein